MISTNVFISLSLLSLCNYNTFSTLHLLIVHRLKEELDMLENMLIHYLKKSYMRLIHLMSVW